jgi:hypothetical protein
MLVSAAKQGEHSGFLAASLFGRMLLERRDLPMSTIITGIVTKGVVVPASPLPEGAEVEVCVKAETSCIAANATCLSAGDLLKLPREQRRAILAEGAASAEELYRTEKGLMGFDAFSEELDDDSEEG